METDNSKEAVNREITELRCSSFYGPISNVKPYGTEAFCELYERTKSNKYKEQIEAMRAEPDPKKQSAMKSKLDYFTPSVICTERKSSCITDFSGVICADLDGKDNPGKTPQQMRVTVLNDPLLHSFMAIVSSLGKGLKVMFRYDPKVATVEDYSHAIMQYLADVCHLKADRACCDPTRACFVSYDPQAYYSTAGLMCGVDVNIWLARYKQFQGEPEKIPANASFKYSPSNVSSSNVSSSSDLLSNNSSLTNPSPNTPLSTNPTNPLNPSNHSLQSDALFETDLNDTHWMAKQSSLAHVQKVSQRINIDIAPNYEDFLRLGFSLATLGEVGRPIFEHCCSYYKGEQTRDLNKFFTDCLHKKRDDIKIATFFELCRTAGVDISNPYHAFQEEMDVANEMKGLPMFPEWVFDQLPPLLTQIVSHVDTVAEKSMMLMTSVTTISSLLPNYYMRYGKHRMEANLSFFVLAKSGSGKGMMRFCARLVKPVHDKLMAESEEARNEYRKRMERQKQEKKGKSTKGEAENVMEQMPPLKVFNIPADSSASAFIRTFAETQRGIMFETEGDTLAKILRLDFGGYSDLLRKAAHHEPITFMRVGSDDKGEGIHIYIDYPCLSVVLSGTPKQLKNLMTDAENGLFSRFGILYVTTNPEWEDQYADDEGESYEECFDRYADDLYVIYTKLVCLGEKGVQFKLTKAQRKEVRSFFRNNLFRYNTLYDGEYDGIMHRLGVMHGRICMVLTALRAESVDRFDEPLVCSDEDVKLALEMIKVLNQHTDFAYRSLSPEKAMKVTLKNMPLQYQLYQALPHEFTTKDALEVGLNLKISGSFVKKCMHKFIQGKDGTGYLVEKLSHGNYRKILKEENVAEYTESEEIY
jgi:hypothetical protein